MENNFRILLAANFSSSSAVALFAFAVFIGVVMFGRWNIEMQPRILSPQSFDVIRLFLNCDFSGVEENSSPAQGNAPRKHESNLFEVNVRIIITCSHCCWNHL